jgi:small multidrug resistance pump
MFGLSPWVLLGLAIATELAGTTALKASDGFTKIGYDAIVVVGYALSFYLMAVSLKDLDLGSTYAIWSGVGTAVTALIGVAVFGESLTWTGIAGIFLIVGGVAVLNASGTH